MTIACASLALGTMITLLESMRRASSTPTEVDDVTLLSGVELDVVAYANHAGQRDEQSGKEVREWFLHGQRDRQPANAERGEHRCDLEPQAVENHEESEDGYQGPRDVSRQTADGQRRADERAVRFPRIGSPTSRSQT